MAAASEEGGVVVNGMSHHARDAENSNSALLVGVEPADFGSDDPLAGFAFQRRLEQAAYALGGGGYRAPAQLVPVVWLPLGSVDWVWPPPAAVVVAEVPSVPAAAVLCCEAVVVAAVEAVVLWDATELTAAEPEVPEPPVVAPESQSIPSASVPPVLAPSEAAVVVVPAESSDTTASGAHPTAKTSSHPAANRAA